MRVAIPDLPPEEALRQPDMAIPERGAWQPGTRRYPRAWGALSSRERRPGTQDGRAHRSSSGVPSAGTSIAGLGGAAGAGAMPTGWMETHWPSHAILIGA